MKPVPVVNIREVLTTREMQVALLLAEGKPNSAIAKELDISVKTIDTHRGHVLKKVGAKNNVELLRLMLQQGLATLGDDFEVIVKSTGRPAGHAELAAADDAPAAEPAA